MRIIFTMYAVMSVLTFLAFALDKSAARQGGKRRRVRESTLHVLELFGGFPGAIAAQQLLRHKSSKQRYIVVLWSIILLHVAAWSYWFWLK